MSGARCDYSSNPFAPQSCWLERGHSGPHEPNVLYALPRIYDRVAELEASVADGVRVRHQVEATLYSADVAHEDTKRILGEQRARADAAEAGAKMAEAERDMLRGVGCCEDGDGPCGACIKCYKSQRDLAVEQRDAAYSLANKLFTIKESP